MTEPQSPPNDDAKAVTPWQAWRNGVSTVERDPLPDGPPVDLDLRPRNPEPVNAIAGRDSNSVQPQRGVSAESTPNRPTHTFENGPESPPDGPESDDEPEDAPPTPSEPQEAPERRTPPA